MGDPTPATLLRAVRRRLLQLRWARALRSAAWATAALLICLALTHLWLAPLDRRVVLAVAALPWLLAAGWAVGRRITELECANWADRHLGGASAFSTWLEIVAEQRASPAVVRFEQWLAAAVPRGFATLQSLPLRLRLTKPLTAVIVSAGLTATVLQIPSLQPAGTRSRPAVATNSPALRDDEDRGNAPQASSQDVAPMRAATTGRQEAAAAESQADGLSPLADAADGGATAALELANAPTAGAAGARAAAGGREAGDSPDNAQETGLAPSWQGELARRLLSSPDATDPATARADPSRAGNYAAAAGPSDAAPATRDFAPAPAAAPAARAQARLGPAEQAYLRAYFAGSGATP